jgi:hypothetical protein
MFEVSSKRFLEFVLFGNGGLLPFVEKKFVDLDFDIPEGISSPVSFCRTYT